MYWDVVIQAWKLKTWGVINRGIVRNLLREEQESPADAGIPARRKNDEKNSSISKL